MTDTIVDAPSYDAFETYERSLACLTMQDEPLWERIRAAFEAGYTAGQEAAP